MALLLPADFADKRARVLAMRADLESCAPLVASWQSAVDALRTAGQLMQTAPDVNSQAVGYGVCANAASERMSDALAAAQQALSTKRAMLDRLHEKSVILDKRLATARKLKQRQDAGGGTGTRLLRSLTRSSEEFKCAYLEDAIWQFEELLCELESEFDFVLIEARRGIAKRELAFLCRFAAGALVGCDGAETGGDHVQAQLGSAAQALCDDAGDFQRRKERFVEDKKRERLTRALQTQGVTPLPRKVSTASTRSSETQPLPSSPPAPDSSSMSSSSSSNHTMQPAAALEQPSIASSQRREPAAAVVVQQDAQSVDKQQQQDRQSAIDTSPQVQEQPRMPSSKTSDPASIASSVASTTAPHEPQVEENDDGDDEDDKMAPLPVPGALSAYRPRPVSVNLTRGFLIGERDGWREYIDRESGATFFVNKTTGEESPTGPEPT